jgi:methylglutaconyl-CoA hydratase
MTTPTYETLQLVVDARGVARLTLNRPDTHNALNATLISELRRAVDWLAAAPGVRAVVLTGTGKTFCAGGDLGWMQDNMKKGRAERVSESGDLALMLRALNELPMPVIGRINGPAYGGGVGMISVCDITIAVDTGIYSLSEVRLGLLPANIAPLRGGAHGRGQRPAHLPDWAPHGRGRGAAPGPALGSGGARPARRCH